MIFRAALVSKILAGKKTQTRRPKKAESCLYEVGRCYAVQTGRGKKQVCRIRVTDVREEFLHELSERDARREGFRDRERFFTHWRQLYRDGPLNEVPVFVISFELDRAHRPRLLDRRPGHGYTENPALALEGEPEAVDSVTQERLTREAQERSEAGRALEVVRRQQLPPEDRLAELRAIAERRGLDVSKDMRVIGRRIDAIEDKLRGKAA